MNRLDLIGQTNVRLGIGKSGCSKIPVTHPIFVRSTKRGVPHISLVFREMWDTTNLNLFPDLRKKQVESCGIPYLAKNERDMGHPTLCGRDKDRMGHS